MKLNKIKSGERISRGWHLTILSQEARGMTLDKKAKLDLLLKYFKYKETKSIIKEAYTDDELSSVQISVEARKAINNKKLSKMFIKENGVFGDSDICCDGTIISMYLSGFFLASSSLTMSALKSGVLVLPALIVQAISTTALMSFIGLGAHHSITKKKIRDLKKLEDFAYAETYL